MGGRVVVAQDVAQAKAVHKRQSNFGDDKRRCPH